MFDLKGIESNEFLEYKNRPLVRKDDELYYGDVSSNYVKMMIMNEKPSVKSGESIPALVIVQLFKPDNAFPQRQFTAQSISDALETASIWLDKYDNK
jgi:hypothetical protein